MVLSDRDILARLLDFKNLELSVDIQKTVKLVREGKIPEKLRKALEEGRIIIFPFPSEKYLKETLGPNSLDLELGDTFRIPTDSIRSHQDIGGYLMKQVIDLSNFEALKDEDETLILSPREKFVLGPGEFVRGITRQIVMLPIDLMARVTGRSRFGRYGLTTTVDAPKIDAGFVGQIVLEIKNEGNKEISLSSGLRICQITFERLSSSCLKPYYEQEDRRFLGQSLK